MSFKKFTSLNEAVKSKVYPIDTNISTDLDKIRKHFNDNVIKNYKTKVLILAYSQELSKPTEGRYIFLSDDFTDQGKSLFNLAFTELKIQVEINVNKNSNNSQSEPLKVNDMVESSSEYDVKYNFYLYWKNIKDLSIDNLKIASYKTVDKFIFYVPLDDKNVLQKIGNSKYTLVK